MPGRGHRTIAGDQQHDVETFRTPQRIDRLLRGLRDRACDVEGRVDRYFHADMAADRLQVSGTRPAAVRNIPEPPPASPSASAGGSPRGIAVEVPRVTARPLSGLLVDRVSFLNADGSIFQVNAVLTGHKTL